MYEFQKEKTKATTHLIIAITIGIFMLVFWAMVKYLDDFDKYAELCDEAKGRTCNSHEVELYARTH